MADKELLEELLKKLNYLEDLSTIHEELNYLTGAIEKLEETVSRLADVLVEASGQWKAGR